MATPTTIWGYVKADGTQQAGTGYSVQHDATNAKGIYYIMFDPPFSDTPAVNVTIQCDNDDYHTGWWVNALILGLTNSEFEVVIVESDFKSKHESNFTFTAVGTTDA